jgi:type IV secretory pathway TrbD component
MKDTLIKIIAGLVILGAGLWLIADFEGPLQALGVFFVVWSHNIDKH